MPNSANVPSEAIVVLQKFIEAGLRKDEPAMRECLTKKTLESGQFNNSGPEGVRFVMGEPLMEGENVVIPLSGHAIDGPADAPAAMQMPCVMVQENGQWKFDMMTTMERMFGGSGLDAVMEQATAAMGEAMQGMTDALGNAMSQAFGESETEASPPNYLEASTDYAPEELFPQLEMTPLPKVSAALSAICRHPVTAAAAMKDLLYQLASDEHDVLFNWFDSQLFEGWTSMFALLNNRIPFGERLNGFRIEPAKHIEQRGLFIDGSDLIYRMWLCTNDGYYSDAEVEKLLPGLLAGLPPVIAPQTVGKRLIHLDEENASIDLYKDKVVPRFMRWISELLGKNIVLEADFDDIYRPEEDTRQLYRWGLNRIYGAIALACRDPKRREKLAVNLHRIHLILGIGMDSRAAEFSGDTLTLTLFYIRGELGCFYENELDRVLAGEVIKWVDPNPSEALSPAGDDEAEKTAEIERDAARALELNAENFRTATTSLREMEPMWATQLQFALNHPVKVELDFDSLHGTFELVQPLIHQGLTAIMEAFSTISGNCDYDALFAPIEHVIIAGASADAPCTAGLTDNTMRIVYPLQFGDARPNKDLVIDALRAIIGLPSLMPGKPELEPAPASDNSAPLYTGDPYVAAAQFVKDIEEALRNAEMWPGPKPDGEIEVKGAFGCENMAFEQWLAWILIARVNDIIAERGSFPRGSAVATYAVREFDGRNAGEVFNVLRNFDDMINRLAGNNA